MLSKNIQKNMLKVVTIIALGSMLQACSFSAVVKKVEAVAGIVKSIQVLMAAFPPATDLATFDASNVNEYLTLSNMTTSSSSGTVTITMTDEDTGDELGSEDFEYSISNHTITFSNPSEVTSWVRSFSTYGNYIDVEFATNVDVTVTDETESQTAAVTVNYNGTPYASASATFSGKSSKCGTGCTEAMR